MNRYLDVVARLGVRSERFDAARQLSAGGRGARENRGQRLPAEKIEALIRGLSHRSPVVRRCCRVREYARRALEEREAG